MLSGKNMKRLAAIIVLLLTAGSFVYYILRHPTAWHQLGQVGAGTILLLLVLYGLTIAALVFTLEGTLELCATRLNKRENLLLTIYTAIVNFFGPLQSGPGFRAVYLKRRHGTKLKNYTLATLLYYGFFAGFSGLFLLSGLLPPRWLAVIGLGGAVLILLGLSVNAPGLRRLKRLELQGAFKLALATLAQVSLVAVIYFVELTAINGNISFRQAVSYTGAANFALFVSLTPGAIGFRESFLLFSRGIHHVSSGDIVSASLLDRGVYVIFLGILFLFVLVTHARKRLGAAAESE